MATVLGFGFSKRIYVTSNFGSTWSPKNDSARYYFVEVSKTTSRIFSSYYSNDRSFEYSNDGGNSWTSGGGGVMFSVFGAASNDGQYVILQRDSASSVAAFYSNNGGATFTTTPFISGGVGKARLARDNGTIMARATTQKFVVSNTGGVTWTDRTSVIVPSEFSYSYTGSYLFLVSGGKLYVSTDNAASVTLLDDTQSWKTIVSNATGSKLVGLTNNGKIFMISR
jgi:hypothetical protein